MICSSMVMGHMSLCGSGRLFLMISSLVIPAPLWRSAARACLGYPRESSRRRPSGACARYGSCPWQPRSGRLV